MALAVASCSSDTLSSSRQWTGRRDPAAAAAAARPVALRRPRRRHGRQCGAECSAVPGGSQDDDATPPSLMGDWRAFRAKLVSSSGMDESWAARQSEANNALLRVQNPRLAQEEVWAHLTGAPELGGLLVATPGANEVVGDERYWQQVVLLIGHDPEKGSYGLVLNRPTGFAMGQQIGRAAVAPSQAVSQLLDAFGESRIYFGGMQSQHMIQLLHGHKRLQGAVEVVPGIYLGGHEAASAEVSTGGLEANDFRFFAGCQAWAPGELQREVAAGVWWCAASSRGVALKQCLQLPVPLWLEVTCLMGGEHASAARVEYQGEDLE